MTNLPAAGDHVGDLLVAREPQACCHHLETDAVLQGHGLCAEAPAVSYQLPRVD